MCIFYSHVLSFFPSIEITYYWYSDNIFGKAMMMMMVMKFFSHLWAVIDIACVGLQLKKYYQPRKSHRIISVTLQGNMVPLYGAGASLALSENGGRVPLTLEFVIQSRGDVVGKLVRTKHHRHVSCTVVLDSAKTKPNKVSQQSCEYDWFLFQFLWWSEHVRLVPNYLLYWRLR